MAEPLRLDVGCGEVLAEGWVGIDPYYDPPADFVGEIIRTEADDLDIFGDGEVAEIRCSHALEHMHQHEIPPALKEWRRVLAPGGKLTIAVPDPVYVLQYLIDNPADPWAYAMVHGRGLYGGDRHVLAIDPNRLAIWVEDAGFTKVQLSTEWSDLHNQRHNVVTAYKPEGT